MSRLTILLLCISFFFAVSTIVKATDVHYCEDNEDYEVKVKEVYISPYPIAPGDQATFKVSAFTGREISSGKLTVEVTYFGWHVYSETHDLCYETTCPVQTGDFLITNSQIVPTYTPPGPFLLKMKMLDAQKKELTCVKFFFNIGLGSLLADI